MPRMAKTLNVVVLVSLLFVGLAAAQEEEVLGCYDQSTYSCDCEATEDTCLGSDDAPKYMSPYCANFCSTPNAVAGCYRMTGENPHSCSCSTPQSSCTANGHIWTDTCACIQGCYDQESHKCDCDKDKDECNGESEFFTGMCNPKCEMEGQHSGFGEFQPGCLVFDESGSHGCKCGFDEETCTNDGNIYTDACDCTTEPIFGCYHNVDNTCDCNISEEDCDAELEANWSGLCEEWCTNELQGEEAPAFKAGCLVFEESGRHACQCSVPDSSCNRDVDGFMRILTDACVCYQGCYNQESHMCDCDKKADECVGEGEFHTALCHEKCVDEALHAPGCLSGFNEEGEGTHSCDCEISEEDCTGNDIWTDACQCYKPAGCYTMNGHQCDCTVTEEECLSGNEIGARPSFYWTESCIGTSGAECSEERESGTGDAPGCYNYMLHRCDCEMTEEECVEDPDDEDTAVTWTEGCRCPARTPGPSR